MTNSHSICSTGHSFFEIHADDGRWYQEWFDRDEYEVVYKQHDATEAERVIDLLERVVQPVPGSSVLDVACGRGRHARSLARRGFQITGTDLSARAIAQARERARMEGLRIRFIRRDMRDPVCDACFDGVVNLFTAFGYFEEEEAHFDAVSAMASSLRPGGWLFQDFLNVSYVLDRLRPEDTRTEGDLQITQRRWIKRKRINKEINLRTNGEVTTFMESVRLLRLEDFQALYQAAGLELAATYGDYEGGPFTADSPRLILYARKPNPAE